ACLAHQALPVPRRAQPETAVDFLALHQADTTDEAIAVAPQAQRPMPRVSASRPSPAQPAAWAPPAGNCTPPTRTLHPSPPRPHPGATPPNRWARDTRADRSFQGRASLAERVQGDPRRPGGLPWGLPWGLPH